MKKKKELVSFQIKQLSGLPRWLSGKESTCNAEDAGSVPGLGRSPGEGNGNPLHYSCLRNPKDKRCLAGYSPWDPKESDMTEQLNNNKTIIRDELLHKEMKK